MTQRIFDQSSGELTDWLSVKQRVGIEKEDTPRQAGSVR